LGQPGIGGRHDYIGGLGADDADRDRDRGLAGAGLAGAAYVPQISHLTRARYSAGISRLAFEVWLLASGRSPGC